jgi:FtsP/CotA-like multicopper oxidase with cupredoxin domain
MKHLLCFALIFLLGTLAFGQCIPPINSSTGLAANWPASLSYDPTRPIDPPAYFSCANYANSPLPLRRCSDVAQTACYGNLDCAVLDDAGAPGQPAVCNGQVQGGTGIRKFVDPLPSLPVATPDTNAYPGSDYYEIELGEYTQKMHSDLPATRLRGYRQTNMGETPFQYLGPAIIAHKNRPVRVKFTNRLPTGAGGNLFLPVDTSYMGAGMGPMMNGMAEPDPQRPMCGTDPKPAGCYAESRATLHLHGGITPWISDGTPHQWITPAGENTAYPQGVSVVNVPDMDGCKAADDGCQTFYYTNQQSARLLFYHDHAFGITRLNVYAGEAAPYVLTDDTEQALLSQNLLPADQIPLVIQDKTFVPSPQQLAIEDPLWETGRWGGEGNLWFPHVYVPAQNPGDSSGVNAFGRWMYGPWFWPPTTDIKYLPIPNPYHDPNCNADVMGWCEPPMMSAAPYLGSGMEAFMDTPVVNGTAYPTVTLDPKAYRFRILNAADDRFFNLQLYVADSSGTEVALKAAEVAAAQEDPTVSPNPDTAVSPKGPAWLQIGTEGGFLPSPVVVPNQPITWVTDPTVFNAGNVDKHSLLLAPAERADVIVDFTPFAGMTLILYNDAPAAFPARVPSYDYYTGSPDLTDIGGAPSVLPGYGPNTRTIMQIKVSGAGGAGTPDYHNPSILSNLQAAFAHHLDANSQPAGVFETSQHPIMVGQGAYNSAYGTSFSSNGYGQDGFARIYDFSLSFNTLSGNRLTMPLEPKALHDEMGGTFDPIYGRMSGTLGLETPNAKAFNQNFVLYPYAAPPVEIFDASKLPRNFQITSAAGQPFAGNELKVTPISTAADGSQIWKITHNGVDTHPLHFHLYDIQLLNRVGWDGFIRKPDPTELGWKDTLRVSPLEDTIVAIRPIIPTLPFDLPNSIRLIDPTMPEGALLASSTNADLLGSGMMPMDPNAEPIDLYNHLVNFGWEYVWHCHILSHEEMDMMHAVVVGMPPNPPTNLAVTRSGTRATLTWTDNSANETSFTLVRANDSGFVSGLTAVTLNPNTTTYTDSTIKNNTTYYYQVFASNVVGDTWDYTNPAINNGAHFPSKSINSALSNLVMLGTAQTAPAAPSNLVATLQAGPQVRLTWKDNSNNESGFVVERAANGGSFAILISLASNTITHTDTTVAAGNTYSYRVYAVNAGGSSAFSNTSGVSLASLPAAPSSVLATVTSLKNNGATVTVTWTDNAGNEAGFTIRRATNAAFTQNLVSATVGANVTSFAQSVARGQTFYYCVRATNGSGVSPCTAAAPFPLSVP